MADGFNVITSNVYAHHHLSYVLWFAPVPYFVVVLYSMLPSLNFWSILLCIWYTMFHIATLIYSMYCILWCYHRIFGAMYVVLLQSIFFVCWYLSGVHCAFEPRYNWNNTKIQEGNMQCWMYCSLYISQVVRHFAMFSGCKILAYHSSVLGPTCYWSPYYHSCSLLSHQHPATMLLVLASMSPFVRTRIDCHFPPRAQHHTPFHVSELDVPKPIFPIEHTIPTCLSLLWLIHAYAH